MGKNKNLYIIIIVFLLVLITILLMPVIGPTLSTILTTITTITGIFSVFIEMKRSADIAECEFIFNLQKQFDDNKLIQEAYTKLDKAYFERKSDKTNIERREIVAYLTFFEMMCNLIIKGVLKINDVDALYGYPFFIAMNNEVIQNTELVKFRQFYRNIYTVYPKWINYRKSRDYEIPYEENIIK